MPKQLSDEQIYELAKKRVKDKKAFWKHLIAYVIVNLILLIIYVLSDPGERPPFLWVNRVFFGGQFSTPVEKGATQHVFRGDLLPKRLGELTAGVHLNAGTSRQYDKLAEVFKPQSIAYLATAADRLWNGRAWQGRQSARRASRFARVMVPLLAGEKIIGPVKKNMERIPSAFHFKISKAISNLA